MTNVITFTLPPTGEFQGKARLVSWQVQPGQKFKCDDVLLEIETDKSVIEIPALHDGKMIKHLVKKDSIITLETPLAKLEIEGEALANHVVENVDETPNLNNILSASDVSSVVFVPPLNDLKKAEKKGTQDDRRLISPAARNLLRTKNINIEHIQGTGPNGRITVADVNRVVPITDAKSKTKSSINTELINTRFGTIRLRTWEPTAPYKNSSAIVLIHGMFADIEAWASLALNLSRSGQRVIALDLPNHGESNASVENFEELVQSVSEVLTLKSSSRHIIVGHSLGAAIAARLACMPTLSAGALILISPLGLGTEIEQSFIKGVTNARNNEAMGRELAKLTHAKTIPSHIYMNELRARIEVGRYGLERISDAASWNGIQQINILEDLNSLICPITILHGKADNIIPWQHALNAPPSVALHLISDVGHMPQWEASSLTAEIILRNSKIASSS